MKKLLRRFLYLSFTFLIMFMVVTPARAYNDNGSINEKLDIESLKQSILINEGTIISDQDIVSLEEENGVVHLVIQTEHGFEDYAFGNPVLNIEPIRRDMSYESIESASWVEALIGIVKKAWDGIKYTCIIVEILVGSNVCAQIGVALLKTMMPNVKYKATANFYRNPNCQPMHSYHCNSPAGGAYWKTSVVRV